MDEQVRALAKAKNTNKSSNPPKIQKCTRRVERYIAHVCYEVPAGLAAILIFEAIRHQHLVEQTTHALQK